MFAEYSKYYEKINHEKPYKEEIEFVYDWAEKPHKILDIGCGTANYWQYYPEGTWLRGIEQSKEMKEMSKFEDKIIHTDVVKFLNARYKIDFDAVTALFDVVNYISNHNWWKFLPLKTGGHFIFDIWDKAKVDKEGFKKTVRKFGNVSREITCVEYDGASVQFEVKVDDNGVVFSESHRMYVWSEEDIKTFCGSEFEIIEVKPTNTWQTWWKLKRK